MQSFALALGVQTDVSQWENAISLGFERDSETSMLHADILFQTGDLVSVLSKEPGVEEFERILDASVGSPDPPQEFNKIFRLC